MMLILTRRMGQEIWIDQGQIKVKVITMHDGVVMLGIDASKKIDIDRKEIFLRKNPKGITSEINGNKR